MRIQLKRLQPICLWRMRSAVLLVRGRGRGVGSGGEPLLMLHDTRIKFGSKHCIT